MNDFERYLNKVKKISDKVPVIRKVLTAVVSAAACLAVCGIVCLFMTGSFTRKTVCDNVVYGEMPEPHAEAFLSDVSYLYAREGSDEWSDVPPLDAGDYTVRAVSKNIFGHQTESKKNFTIERRPIAVSFETESVLFGDSVNLTLSEGTLAYSDRLKPVTALYVPKDGTVPSVLGINEISSLVSDVDGNDVSGNYEITNINEAEISLSKREITVSMKPASFEYDGTPHRCDDYDIISGQLFEGHSLIAVSESEKTDIGEAGASVSKVIINDENGNDVTDFYIISSEDSTVTVTKRIIKVRISDASHEYDGTPLTSDAFEIVSGSLLDGDVLRIVTKGSITSVGTAENALASWSVSNGGNDVSGLYEITAVSGKLTVTKRKITVRTLDASFEYDGSAHCSDRFELESGTLVREDSLYLSRFVEGVQDVGTGPAKLEVGVMNRNGDDVTAMYDIHYNYGTVTVTPRKITVRVSLLGETTMSGQLLYNGERFTQTSVTFIGEKQLVRDHYYEVTPVTEVMKVGEYSDIKYKITVGYGGIDLTRNYDITVISEKQTVVKRDITLVSYSYAEEYYHGIELKCEMFFCDNFDIGSFDVRADFTSVLRTIGETENIFTVSKILKNGEDVTDCFNIHYVYGTLAVKKRCITLYSASDSKKYDGKALTAHDYKIVDGSLLNGDTVKAQYSGSQTEIGTSANTWSARIYDGSGNDVTDVYYTLTLMPGELTVYDVSGDTGSGLSGGADDSSSMSTDPFSPQNIPVFKIKTDTSGSVYLRNVSMGDFDGFHSWSAAPAYPIGRSSVNPLTFSSIWAEKAGFIEHHAELAALNENAAANSYVPYYSTGYSAEKGNDVSVSFPARTSHPFTFFSPAVEDFLKYSVRTDYLAQYRSELDEYEAFVRNNYLSVPDSTREILLSLAEMAGLDPSSSTIIFDVAEYIQHSASYNLDFKPFPQDCDIVTYFLVISREGVCQHFAAAATLMYRTLGIPARYTTGYVTDTVAGEWIEVTQKTAHAWTEVFISGVGWVQVEVTGSTAAGGVSDTGMNSDGGEFDEEGESERLKTVERNSTSVIAAVDSAQKEYDGKPFSDFRVTDVYESLLKGDHFEFTAQSDAVYVGDYTIKAENLRIVDENGNDVTDEYKSIDIKEGILSIVPAVYALPEKVELAGSFRTDMYSLFNKEDFSSGLKFISMDDNLISDGRYIWTNEPGSYVITPDLFGIDENGDGRNEYEVDGSTVNVYAYTLSNIQEMTVSKEEAIARSLINLDYAGRTETVSDMKGNVYNVLSIAMASFSTDYNGSICDCSQFEIITGQPVQGDVITVLSSCSPRFAGTYENKCGTLKVTDSYGNDVTSSYIVKVFPGVIEINTTDIVKNGDRNVNLWSSFMMDDIVDELMSDHTVQNKSFEYGEGIFTKKNNALYAQKPGKAKVNYSSELDLNEDGIPEYRMKASVRVRVVIPAPAIIAASLVLIVPAGIYVFRRVRRSKRK